MFVNFQVTEYTNHKIYFPGTPPDLIHHFKTLMKAFVDQTRVRVPLLSRLGLYQSMT